MYRALIPFCAFLILHCTNSGIVEKTVFKDTAAPIPVDREISAIESNQAFLKGLPLFALSPRIALYETTQIDNQSTAKVFSETIYSVLQYLSIASADGIYTDRERIALNARFQVLNRILQDFADKWRVDIRTDRILSPNDNLITPRQAAEVRWKLSYLNSDRTLDLDALKADVSTAEVDICREYYAGLKEAANPPNYITETYSAKDLIKFRQVMQGFSLCSAFYSKRRISEIIRYAPITSMFIEEIPYAMLTPLYDPKLQRCSDESESVNQPLVEQMSSVMDRLCSLKTQKQTL